MEIGILLNIFSLDISLWVSYFTIILGKRFSNTLFSMSFWMCQKMSLISIEIMDKTERLHELKEIVKKFHPVNYDVFRYIITHLNRFSIFQFCLSC